MKTVKIFKIFQMVGNCEHFEDYQNPEGWVYDQNIPKGWKL